MASRISGLGSLFTASVSGAGSLFLPASPSIFAWRLADSLRGYLYLRMHVVEWETIGAAALTAALAEGDALGEASARLMSRLGMREEGRIRHHVFVRGAWRDSVVHSILEDEWVAARAS